MHCCCSLYVSKLTTFIEIADNLQIGAIFFRTSKSCSIIYHFRTHVGVLKKDIMLFSKKPLILTAFKVGDRELKEMEISKDITKRI